ncbi:MAG: hypothetical protein JF609_00200, partial [Verrucomicrobia bacterium]|nr:hypothetical protein [Verrucomicrobiota bacterium]
MPVELTDKLLSNAAGWEVMKLARAYLGQGQVVSSSWSPPLLRGVVRVGDVFFRASLVIKDEIDIENLCTCRDAREWGKICAHGVAVGLHHLKGVAAPAPGTSVQASAMAAAKPAAPVRKASSLQRDTTGTAAELCVIFPPNFDQALTRGKVMLVLEARWDGGRAPLNALPKGRTWAFSAADDTIIDQLEALTNGETPAMLQMEVKDFAALLPLLVGHANLTLGKASTVTVTRTPLPLPIRATLEANGEIVLAISGKPMAFVRVGDWVWHNQTLQPLGLPAVAQTIFQAPVRVPRPQVPVFLSQH